MIRGQLQTWWTKEVDASFGDWLLKVGIPDPVQTLADRFCQFSLSTSVFDVPYSEGRKVIEKISRYGLPGVPKGGAREVDEIGNAQTGDVAHRAGVPGERLGPGGMPRIVVTIPINVADRPPRDRAPHAEVRHRGGRETQHSRLAGPRRADFGVVVGQ